jgi:hypothetical protein
MRLRNSVSELPKSHPSEPAAGNRPTQTGHFVGRMGKFPTDSDHIGDSRDCKLAAGKNQGIAAEIALRGTQKRVCEEDFRCFGAPRTVGKNPT